MKMLKMTLVALASASLLITSMPSLASAAEVDTIPGTCTETWTFLPPHWAPNVETKSYPCECLIEVQTPQIYIHEEIVVLTVCIADTGIGDTGR